LAAKNTDFIGSMRKIQAEHGVGLYAQAFEMLRLAVGKNKIHPTDYFDYGIYRPTLSADEKKAILSNRAITVMNSRLSPECLSNHANLIDDKLLSGQLLGACGFPTTKNKAVFSPHRKFNFIQTLSTTDEIKDYITDAKNLPLFGKPILGSRSLGVASIISCSDDKSEVTFGDGQQVSADALARDIATKYDNGYLFQSLVVQPPKIEKIVGTAAATFRIVTIQSENGPIVLYGVWKQPQKGAMADRGANSYYTVALIDIETGTVVRNQWGYCIDGEARDESFSTGARIIDYQIPHWQEIMQMTVSAHELFADHGILGWDIFITTDGPVINEVNKNPLHTLYQRAAGRGIMNADFVPLIENARREVERRING